MASASNASLRLLSAYGSSGDESEEDIPGPKVSVKRSHDKEDVDTGDRKRQSTARVNVRLPPPTALSKLFVSNVSEEQPKDSPNDHGGRIRSFAHERGNWASYVYVAVDLNDSLQSFVDVACSTCDSTLDLQRFSAFHISLTRTVVLKHHWIDSFASSVKQISEAVIRFPICLGELKVYSNEERTRTFIGIVVSAGQEELLKVTKRLDAALADFKLPSFYEEASFHVSIAWCVGDRAEEIMREMPRLQSTLEMFISSQPLQWRMTVNKLNLNTGNKQFVFHLR